MSSSEKNAVVSPAWVDEKFVKEALSEAEGKQVAEVSSLTVEPAVKAGANFMSSLLRLSCEVRLAGGGAAEARSLVLKVGLGAGPMADLAEEGQVFEREARVYRELLPQAEEALRAAEGGGGGEWRPLAPRTLGAATGGGGRPAWLLLEDLRASGFRTPQPGAGLDRAHCSLGLSALARLHAASARLLEDSPPLRTDPLFSRSPLTSREACDQLASIVPRHALALSAALAASGRSALADRYQAAAERIVGRLRQLDGGGPPALRVLLHGDLWKNNFLFRYSGQQPTDVRLLDFQMVNTGAPAIDVVHFLYANASEETHRQHLEQLVSEYHGTLQATLKALGLHQQADAYPLQELWRDMDRCAPIALHCAILMGVILGVEAHGADIQQSYSSEDKQAEILTKVYSNPTYLSCIEYLSPHFQKQGVL
ncbi:uncharacterized protein LOC126324024 [Schistocerca gregaria]|uniref:uncharacterized protein LOC126324024 n=1 Tax=Schistocerca gregaria TaxID=7010 RepID=UPI00211EABD9|nr:uncharacterized protein LOC126324024 [Schistocerca gregaria]